MRKMDEWKMKPKIAFFITVGAAGGVGLGIAAATDLSPLLSGLLAGLLAAFLGTITYIVILRAGVE